MSSVVFFTSNDCSEAALKRIINSKHEIIAVFISCPCLRVQKLASENGIPIQHFRGKDVKEIIEETAKKCPDVIVSVNFNHTIPKIIQDVTRFGCYTVRMSNTNTEGNRHSVRVFYNATAESKAQLVSQSVAYKKSNEPINVSLANASAEQIGRILDSLEYDKVENTNAGGEQSMKTGTRKFPTLPIIIGVIILALLLLYSAIFGMPFSKRKTVYTPDLRGMTVEEAENYIRSHRSYRSRFTLTVDKDTIYDSSYTVGSIAAQTPTAGTSTKSEMTTLKVTVCEEDKEEQLFMPDIVGQNYKDAMDELNADYGVNATYSFQSSVDYDKDKIASTNPAAGEKLTAGQSVMLYVSKGADESQDSMISVVGLTESAAKRALESAGFKTGKTKTVDSYEDKGIVVGQSVEEGEITALGTKVDLEISKGPEEQEDEPEEPEEPDETDNDGDDNNDDENTENKPAQNIQGNGTHYITINMPSGRSESSDLNVEINGKSLYSDSIDPSDGVVKLTVSGTIANISIRVDGSEYSNYTVTS